MSEVGSLKFIEACVVLLAGGLFVWWQLRDVRRAQEKSRAERESSAVQTPPDVDEPADIPRRPPQ